MMIRGVFCVFVALLLPAWASAQGTDLEALRHEVLKDGVAREEAGRLIVSHAGQDWEIVGVSARGDPIFQVGPDRVSVLKDLVTGQSLDALKHLPALVQHARQASLELATLRLRDVALIGPHLSSPDVWVLPEGVARRMPVPAPRSASEVVARAGELIRESESAPVNGLGRAALQHFLVEIGREEGTDAHVEPSFTRRLVRAGWLRRLVDRPERVHALEAAVTQADERLPATLYEGSGIRVAELVNAFRDSTWTVRTPERSGYAITLPAPAFLGSEEEITLLASFSPGENPITTEATPIRLEMRTAEAVVASWSPEEGFVTRGSWREALALEGAPEAGLLPSFFPPHVLHVDVSGDVRRLITAHGSLTPVQDSTPAAIARFLDEAARALPDAAHLDLIGQRLFRYVYDSPDVRFPEIMGFEEAKGEIHQTAAETIATTVGGLSRGDCDDLAELYQAIAAEQNRLGHLMNLPAHAAFGFAEERNQQWFVAVLQTGPPLEFSASTPADALGKAYGAFGMLEAFDPDQISIAVRFSGENVRSDYVLGSRIFTDAAYSAAMIDVQRDWHLHTYQRGIGKMRAMLDGGDRDPANLRELAGLFERTGQHAEAADYLRMSREISGDPTLGLTIRLIDNLFEAKETEAARAEFRIAADVRMSPLQKQLDMAFGPVALQLIAVLAVDARAIDLALEVSDRFAIDGLLRQMGPVMSFLTGRRFRSDVWDQSSEMTEIRAVLRLAAATLTDLVRRAGPDALIESDSVRRAASFVETWIQVVAPRDVSDRGDRLFRYSEAATYACAALGDATLEDMATRAPPPKSVPTEFGQRLTGLGQLRADLPWFRISVPFWSTRLYLLFERGRPTLNSARALELAGQVLLARAEALALGIDHVSFEIQEHTARLIAALLQSNESELRERFVHVARQADKSLTDATATMLGTVARFVDPSFFARTLEIWHAEVEHPPSAFAIAWTAMRFQAQAPALAAARAAVARYPDEPAFAEELRGMEARALQK